MSEETTPSRPRTGRHAQAISRIGARRQRVRFMRSTTSTTRQLTFDEMDQLTSPKTPSGEPAVRVPSGPSGVPTPVKLPPELASLPFPRTAGMPTAPAHLREMILKAQIPAELRSCMEVFEIIVTPDLAQRILDGKVAGPDLEAAMPMQRRLREEKIALQAWRIERGTFRIVPDAALIFDLSGRLIDGQHRLRGVVRTNRPALFRVVLGAEIGSYATINDGVAPKTLPDVLMQEGIEKRYVDIITRLLYMLWHDAEGNDPKSSAHPPNDEMLGFFLSLIKGTTTTVASRSERTATLVHAFGPKIHGKDRKDVAGFYIYQGLGIDEIRTVAFVDRIQRVGFLGDDDPAKALYNFLNDDATGKHSKNRPTPMGHVQAWWTALGDALHNRTRKTLRHVDLTVQAWPVLE